jgi:glycosyltransferase involved in cell wall biosynthesis
MKVLHLDTERGWRGGQTQLAHLMRGSDEGMVVAHEGSEVALRYQKLGLPCLGVQMRGSWLGAGAIRNVARHFRPDLIAAHTAHAHRLALAIGGAPVVVHRRVDFRIPRRSRHAYRSAAGFVAVSQAVARVLTDGGVDPGRIVVVYDGVLSRTKHAAESLPWPSGTQRVLAVGALVAHKDHHTMVRALAYTPARVHLAIAGEGGLARAIREEALRVGVAERLHLLGARSDVGALLDEADLFCHSSAEEGLGSAVAEAMLGGVPVVATRAGGVPEVVAADGTLVDPRQPRALAKAIEEALANPAARTRAEAAVARIRDRFGVPRLVAETQRAYRRFA